MTIVANCKRQKMPHYQVAVLKNPIVLMKYQKKLESGEIGLDQFSTTVQNETRKNFKSMINHFPIFQIMPMGMFATANLYAGWAICAASNPISYLWMENIFMFDPGMATMIVLKIC